LAFFPASSGFQRYSLPQVEQLNFGSVVVTAMQYPSLQGLREMTRLFFTNALG
jgi:hypothetical protein